MIKLSICNYIKNDPDYQYLKDYEKKVKQQLAKANINYRSKNRDKISQQLKTSNKNKDNEEFKQKLRERSKAYYHKKKKEELTLLFSIGCVFVLNLLR